MNIPVSKPFRSHLIIICDQLKSETTESEWTPVFKPLDSDDFISSSQSECLVELVEEEKKGCEINAVKEPNLKDYIDEITINELRNQLFNFNQNETDKESLTKLEIFCIIPPSLISDLCKELKVMNLESNTIASILNYLSCRKPAISLANALAIIHQFVYSKIIDGNIDKFQTFTTAFVQFSENYSSAVFEGLFLPCFMCKNLEIKQINLLNRLTKLVKVPDNVNQSCLKKIFEEVEPRENLFQMLQNLLEKKVSYNEEIFSLFAKKLKLWSSSYNKSIKFTHLLISVISLYGNKASAEHISIFKDIVRNNNTLLKNAAEKALNKLCQQ